MNIFDPLITGSLSVSGSGEISGDLTVLGTINATISGTTSNAITASEAPKYTLTSSFDNFTGSYTTGSFTGSFSGNGGGLYNISASGVTGLNLTQIADGNVTASVSNTNGLRVNSKTEITGSLIVTEGITGSIDYSNITNKPTLVSGSSQIDITGTTGYSTFSSSFSSSISEVSSSITITTNNLDGRLDNIETSTGSLNSFTSSINTTIKNKLNTDGVISGSVQVNLPDVTGYSTFSSSVSSSIGSLSSSVATTTNNLFQTMSSLSSSFTDTDNNHTQRLNTIESRYATTGSNIFNGTQTITGSLYVSQNLIVQGESSLENITASAVSIGTNKIILNNDSPAIRYAGISVFDSGSTNVTASLLYDSLTNNWKFEHSDVGTNDASIFIYGPLGVGLDNAPTLDGNFITKVENNGHGHHITTSSIFDNGSKVSINSNTEITGSLTVTGVIKSTTTPLVSGSSQIDHNTTTNYVSNQHIDHTTVSISAGNGLSGGGTIASTRTISLDTASSTFTTGVKSKMNTDGVISGSSQVVAALPSGTVSGSSQILVGTTIHSGSFFNGISVVSGSVQIDLTTTTNYSSGIKTRLNAEGVISGSSQITYNSISGIPSGIVSGSSQITLTSTQVTNGLGYTPYNATNPNGYITGISFANVSSKPTTISGYGITDAITTGNIGSQSVSNASTVANITPTQFFNNMGDSHGARTSFDASTPSYGFGFRFIQGNTNGPALGGGGQFYSWYLGLGNDYPATGSGSYGMHVAVARGATTPYMSVRYNENNSLGSWIKIAAGYADTAGSATTAGNITAYTINQSVGTGNNVKFASHVDLNISGSAFRFYDGSTFRGGLGLDDWAHGGSAANVTVFATGVLHFTSGGDKRAYFNTSGHFLPNANATYDLGSTGNRWRTIFTSDLSLSNGIGDYTIVEGEEKLYLYNNKNNKVYSFVLQEEDPKTATPKLPQ
jgi:hypothetical protein